MRGRIPTVCASVLATVILTTGATTAPSPTPTEDAQDHTRAAEYWLEDYGITEAWETTRGEGTTIAIIDTGIGEGPSEFDGAVAAGKDFSGIGSPDGRTPVGVLDGSHGSWVASLAAGRGTGSDEGMIGVAPEAELLSASIGFGAASSVPFAEQVAEAIVWAVDEGADVINLSFTTNTLDWDLSWDDAFMYAFDHDVVVVVAAGNRGRGTDRVGAPATIPGVLTVGGVDRNRRASVEASTQGITIGIAAPSEELLGVSADGEVVEWSGTSGAAPIVAGIAALIRSAHPELNAANVINRIIETATTPPSGDSPNLYGYGLVDAAAAVNDSVATVDENPMGSLAEWIRLYRRADAPEDPAPSVTPVVVDPLPPADTPTQAGSALLPSQESLLYGTVPLLGITTGAILVALGVTAAARRIRSTFPPRTSSR